MLGNAPGEVVAHVLREGEEGGRQEGAEAEAEGHDPAAIVLHELVAVQVTGAEAQTVGLDLGPESGTLFPLRVPENLSQELSSEPAMVQEGHGETRELVLTPLI